MKINLTESQLSKMIENIIDGTLSNEFKLDPMDVPNVLYHATFERNLESMLENGIGAKSDIQDKMSGVYDEEAYNSNGVFLASDVDEAIEYIANDERRGDDKVVVIVVPKHALKLTNLQYDTNNQNLLEYLKSNRVEPLYKNEFTFFYKGVIDAMRTKLIKN